MAIREFSRGLAERTPIFFAWFEHGRRRRALQRWRRQFLGITTEQAFVAGWRNTKGVPWY